MGEKDTGTRTLYMMDSNGQNMNWADFRNKTIEYLFTVTLMNI